VLFSTVTSDYEKQAVAGGAAILTATGATRLSALSLVPPPRPQAACSRAFWFVQRPEMGFARTTMARAEQMPSISATVSLRW